MIQPATLISIHPDQRQAQLRLQVLQLNDYLRRLSGRLSPYSTELDINRRIIERQIATRQQELSRLERLQMCT
jgi:multidrug efflux pump subunit AcrA (membrane-fusion protein)